MRRRTSPGSTVPLRWSVWKNPFRWGTTGFHWNTGCHVMCVYVLRCLFLFLTIKWYAVVCMLFLWPYELDFYVICCVVSEPYILLIIIVAIQCCNLQGPVLPPNSASQISKCRLGQSRRCHCEKNVRKALDLLHISWNLAMTFSVRVPGLLLWHCLHQAKFSCGLITQLSQQKNGI